MTIFVLLSKCFRYHFILLQIALYFFCAETHSQLYTKARVLTTHEGLSDNRITCFFKDRTGFVWIGTRNGLNRYDGLRIKTFRPAAGNSISNEVINDIAEDSRGNLWVATMDGLNIYNPVNDHWECLLPSSDKNANDIPSNLIWDIDVDKEDRVWIASDVQQFCFYQPLTKKFTYFDWPAFVRGNPHFSNSAYNSIKRFTLKNEDEILLASNKALVKLNPQTKTFSYLAGSYRSDVWDMRYDASTGKTYVSIEKGKLLTWDENTSQLTETVPSPEPYPSEQFLSHSSAEIWMAAETGLIKIGAGNSVTLAHHIPQLTGSLQPGAVAAVMQGDGVNWVGTFNGISVYDTEYISAFFLPLIPTTDKESSNSMGGVWFDKEHSRYFVCATEYSAVFVIDRNGGMVKKITADADGKPFNHCNTIKGDRENKIWLLTDDAVYYFDHETASFKKFNTPNEGELVVFRDVVLDAEGNYWFGSFHKGIYYYLAREKVFAKPKGEGFQNVLTTTSLHADEKKNAVWIGTYSIGFYRYDLTTKKLAAYMETETHPEYAALNLVNDIAQDKTGAIWVATQAGGLFRFKENPNGGQSVEQFSMKTGLVENSYGFICTGDSSLWALSGNGLIQLNIKNAALVKPKAASFEFSSYLSDVRFPHKIFYNGLDKEVLVAVGGGLLLHRIRSESGKAKIPVVITSVSVNENLLQSGALQMPDEYHLASDENNLVFSFAKLYYGSSPDYETQYKLEGWDEQWIKSGSDQQAVYQNLSSGHYEFLVRVKDTNGNIVGEVSTMKFRIKPPFWQRWWAISLMALLFLLIVYSIFKRRVNAIKRQAFIKQQLTELEAKALRAQMNPHFIFNSLNAIQELIVTENINAAYDYLSKFSKLLRLVLNNSEKAAIPLADELSMLQLYLELESLRFRKSFSYEIQVEKSLDAEGVLVPPLLLQPFIENAVWHGLMLKEGEKKLRLSIRQHEKHIVCVIEDNGIGREKSAEIKSQKIGASHFESKGLKLSQQRIQLLGLEGKKGTIKIEDLYANNLATGTRVSIELPVTHN